MSFFCGLASMLVLVQPVMATPDSTYFDPSGEPVSYEDAVALMNTGDYVLRPRDAGGFQLEARAAVTPSLSSRIVEAGTIAITTPGHTLMPITITGERGEVSGAAIFDTGTFVPFIPTPEVSAQIGRIESLEAGDARFESVPVGEYSDPELIRSLSQAYAAHLETHYKGAPLLGIVGMTLFGDTALKLDLGDGIIEMDAPVPQNAVAVAYSRLVWNIWLEATVSGEPGYVHLDSGYPRSWIEASLTGPVSLSFADDDFTDTLDVAAWDRRDQSANFATVDLDILAGMGTDALSELEIVIRPDEGLVYITQNR